MLEEVDMMEQVDMVMVNNTDQVVVEMEVGEAEAPTILQAGAEATCPTNRSIESNVLQYCHAKSMDQVLLTLKTIPSDVSPTEVERLNMLFQAQVAEQLCIALLVTGATNKFITEKQVEQARLREVKDTSTGGLVILNCQRRAQ